ncbi:PEPxxWA-CTERM sorting domain-containing protein [uncultured Sphingomonas sp.]|uniref:PEPxxWA-CTERM sorting domain-containing protein n=1 Tax=uncultured Sphingomonas sp. TaxID=158754 RepID=UPI0035CB8040
MMMSNFKKPAIFSLALMAMSLTAGQANAQAVTFNTTGNMADNGGYGDVLPFKPTSNASSLRLQVTGWQINQFTGAINSAWVGAYSPGLGVTGIGDQSGDNGYHQIDNAGFYTDFVLLQFNAPVTLQSLTLNSFTLGNASVKDNDLAFYAASFPEVSWDDKLNLSAYTLPASLWTTVTGAGKDGQVMTGTKTASREWLVAAAFNSGTNDAFKIESLTVVAPAPEPGTWAMMIVGFGMIGGMARYRRGKQAVSFA